MSGHSKTKMSVSGYLITVGALVWWVAANGDNTADQHKSLDDNRMTEQLICRSESAEGVMSFSDFPGDCAREGDTVTISVSVPRQADIQLHKEQYREIMDLLDRMAAERHRRELISIERRQLDLEYALAQIQMDLPRQQEPEVHYTWPLQGFRPHDKFRRPHVSPRKHAKDRYRPNLSHHRFPHSSQSQVLNITPGTFNRPIQAHLTVYGQRRF
jgi:hypothetical protein